MVGRHAKAKIINRRDVILPQVNGLKYDQYKDAYSFDGMLYALDKISGSVYRTYHFKRVAVDYDSLAECTEVADNTINDLKTTSEDKFIKVNSDLKVVKHNFITLKEIQDMLAEEQRKKEELQQRREKSFANKKEYQREYYLRRTKKLREQKKQEKERFCTMCGTSLKGTRNVKYCESCKEKLAVQRKQEKEKNKVVVTKVCPICGKTFEPDVHYGNRERQIYCSSECQLKANSLRQREKTARNHKVYERICPVCGKHFKTEHGRKKYDTLICQRAGQQILARERQKQDK